MRLGDRRAHLLRKPMGAFGALRDWSPRAGFRCGGIGNDSTQTLVPHDVSVHLRGRAGQARPVGLGCDCPGLAHASVESSTGGSSTHDRCLPSRHGCETAAMSRQRRAPVSAKSELPVPGRPSLASPIDARLTTAADGQTPLGSTAPASALHFLARAELHESGRRSAG